MSISIKPALTIEELPEFFSYEPKSGILTWRKNVPAFPRSAGAIVGFGGRGFYRQLRYNGKFFFGSEFAKCGE